MDDRMDAAAGTAERRRTGMKIDENCIDHNVSNLVRQLIEGLYDYENNADWYKMMLAEINGVILLAEMLKEVLRHDD